MVVIFFQRKIIDSALFFFFFFLDFFLPDLSFQEPRARKHAFPCASFFLSVWLTSSFNSPCYCSVECARLTLWGCHDNDDDGDDGHSDDDDDEDGDYADDELGDYDDDENGDIDDDDGDDDDDDDDDDDGGNDNNDDADDGADNNGCSHRMTLRQEMMKVSVLVSMTNNCYDDF